jgi:hypothetical protein
MTAATRAACSGSRSASQRSLVTVNDIVGTDPVRAAHSAGPPNSVTSAAAWGADFTSFHSIAGRTTAPASSTVTMPCCWAATPTASARASRSRPAAVSASHQRSGWHSVPSGCGADASPTTVPSSARTRSTLVDCVDESIPATSFTTVTVTKLRRERH